MNSIFKKIERFLMNLIIITLIVLISLQIAMKNDTTYQRLKELEYTVKGIFQKQDVVEVIGENETLEGVIEIDLLQDYSLPQVWVVKNGNKMANFADGIVKIRVEQGDFLVLDCKFYNKPLWFEITNLSPNIRNWYLGQQFRITAEEKRIGVVEFYDKL